MNFFLIIILTFLIFEYALEFFSKYYNLKSLKTNLPSEFDNFYSQKKYTSSQKYTKENIKFSLYTSTLNLLILLSIIFLGGFNHLDLFLRKFVVSNDIMLGVLYFVAIIILNTILSLPKSYYSTFYIEEKYGFNKTTLKVFINDRIKGILLSILIGGLILFIALFIYKKIENNFWVYLWIFISAFIIFIQMSIYLTPKNLNYLGEQVLKNYCLIF